MKKTLLLTLSISSILASFGQNQNSMTKQNTKGKDFINEQAFPQATINRPYQLLPNSRQAQLATKTKFTSSMNVLGVILAEANDVTANQLTNTILFTHRIGPDWNPPNVNTGFIAAHFSTNNGTTWDSLLHMQDQVNLCRYPSGTLFNPSGNTVSSGLFAVVSGPFHPGTNWNGNYFASTQLNNTNNNSLIQMTNTVPYQSFARIGMQSCDNKVVVIGSLYLDPNATTIAGQLYRGAVVNIGTFNSSLNKFNWAVDSIKPNFLPDPADGSNQAFTIAQTAWSKDGTIGYVIFDGVDASSTGANATYQPLVYKSNNGGGTWAQLPLYDFAQIPSIGSKLIPCTDGVTKKAWFSEESSIDAIVDANNDLHIFCKISSGSSTSPDSLGYTWNPINNISYFYDTHTTATGWDAFLIDSIQTITANASSPFADGATIYTVDARLQISRTTDGTHLFYTWLDSDPIDANGENALPDIYSKGYDLTTNQFTNKVKFTNDKSNYFLYASDIALVNGSNFSIPATVSNSKDGSGNAINPFDHYYVSGITFNQSEFVVGINEHSNLEPSSVSQNFPNPFNGTTSFTVSLNETSLVSVDVYNTLGQKVYNTDAKKLGIGNHTISIDASKLSSGIYFYTVNTGSKKVTQKMIVK